MKVTSRAVADLIEDPANVRTHNERNLEAIKGSLVRFGQQKPIVITPDKIVVAGNGTLAAARALGWEKIDTVTTALEGGDITAFGIADNRTAELAVWDIEALGKTLAAMSDEDRSASGWTDEELSFLNGEPEPDAAGGDEDGEADAVQDEIPATPTDATTKLGDLFILGEHRLLCGDSTNPDAVARLMDGEKASLVHADPPYGMGKESDGVENDNLYRDKLDAFQMDWWQACRPHLIDSGSAYIWGNAEGLWRLWFAGGLCASERMTMRNEIVWDKANGLGMSSDTHRQYATASERCLFFMLGEQGFNNNADNYWDGWDSVVNYLRREKQKTGWDVAKFKRLAGHSETSGCHWFDRSQWSFPTKEVYESWQSAAREHDAFKREHDELKREHDELKREFYETRAHFNNTHDNMTDVWNFPRVQGEERFGHATPKPVPMIARAIKSSAPKDSTVFEPFLGTGTTLIAAEQTSRRCFGVEISPAYCDTVVARWEALTGRKAVLET